MDFLQLPKRPEKKRKTGITSISDFGVPYGQLKDYLADYGDYIDFAKIAIGTAYVTKNLKQKIELYKSNGVIPYFGGTLFEKCYYQGKISEYLAVLQSLEIEWVEISTGTLPIPLNERIRIINEVKRNFSVLAEVGSKDSEKPFDPHEWKKEIGVLLHEGIDYVICEGRDSGTAGIYDKKGHVNDSFILNIIDTWGFDKIIFEAPTAKQQMYFIKKIGPNVNLGNIKIQDVLMLEAERLGLRSETFFLGEKDANISHSPLTY